MVYLLTQKMDLAASKLLFLNDINKVAGNGFQTYFYITQMSYFLVSLPHEPASERFQLCDIQYRNQNA